MRKEGKGEGIGKEERDRGYKSVEGNGERVGRWKHREWRRKEERKREWGRK